MEEVERVVDTVKATVDSLATMQDPVAQAQRAGRLLKELPGEQARLRKIRRDAVLTLRAQKVSYRKIAKDLGISLARVQQIEAGERGRETRGVPFEEPTTEESGP
jgi:DNA-directed RNA polymerase specialized sigma24 family protein